MTDNNLPTLETYANGLQTKLAMANTLLKSGLIPQSFKSAEAVLVAILYGQEIGLSPMQALQSVLVVQGKPTLDAAALKAICLNNGMRFETIAWTDKVCSLRGIRGDWKEEFSFSWQDAVRMGLAEKDNWRRMPKQMLYARCVSVLARNMGADIIRGFYSREEMLDSIDVTPKKEIKEYSHSIDAVALDTPYLDTSAADEPAPQEPIAQPQAQIAQSNQKWFYKIENATGKQLEFLEREGVLPGDEADVFVSPKKLGAKLDKYLIEVTHA